MRRLVPSAVLAGLTISTILAASAVAGSRGETAASSSNLRGVCSAVPGLDVYFWPQGHPAIPAIGFPTYGPPHAEFYRAHDFTNAPGFLGFLERAQWNLSRQCPSVADRVMPAVTNASTATDQQKIRCNFVGNVDIRFAPITQVTVRTVRKVVFVRVKGKRVRRVIRQRIRRVTRLGIRGTASAAGIPDTLVEVRITATPSVRWDTRHCAPVGLTE